MYITKIAVGKSDINGHGVFSKEFVKKGSVVWKYEPSHDIRITKQEFDNLSEAEKQELYHIAYLSPWTNLWVYPPKGDPAVYTNHSKANNLTVVFDDCFSPEPFFIANRDINIDEEITNNYLEFDKLTRETKPYYTN